MFLNSLEDIKGGIDNLKAKIESSQNTLNNTAQFWEVMSTFEVEGSVKMSSLFNNITQSFDIF